MYCTSICSDGNNRKFIVDGDTGPSIGVQIGFWYARGVRVGIDTALLLDPFRRWEIVDAGAKPSRLVFITKAFILVQKLISTRSRMTK